MTDEGLVHLAKLKTLKGVALGGTKVTQAGIDKLKQALPECLVEGGK